MKLINGTDSVVSTIPVGLTPNDVVYSAVNNVIYVANSGSGTISIIHIVGNSFAQNILKYGLIVLLVSFALTVVYRSVRFRN